MPRRNASSFWSSAAFVSARAFVFPDDDDDDDDSGLDDADAFEKTSSSSFWTKLCRRRRRRRVFPRVPVVETEGGTPGETMRSISHKFDAFAFVLHFLLLRIGFGFFSLQNTTNYIYISTTNSSHNFLLRGALLLSSSSSSSILISNDIARNFSVWRRLIR